MWFGVELLWLVLFLLVLLEFIVDEFGEFADYLCVAVGLDYEDAVFMGEEGGLG